jgi:hypothetical protein
LRKAYLRVTERSNERSMAGHFARISKARERSRVRRASNSVA